MHHKDTHIALSLFLAFAVLGLGMSMLDAVPSNGSQRAQILLAAAATPTPTTTTTKSIGEIENPLNIKTLDALLKRIAAVLLAIGVPLAGVMIAWGGWLRMTAGANTEQVTKSNSTIKYAIIGLIILIMAQGIVSLVQDLLQVKK